MIPIKQKRYTKIRRYLFLGMFDTENKSPTQTTSLIRFKISKRKTGPKSIK